MLSLQVLWFAVVGTLWNSIGIGMSLFAICQIEAFGVQDINLQENLLFASIISAVDPVAVLSVFEDVSVNEQLYIVVFGECLFNDAVTVVSGYQWGGEWLRSVCGPFIVFVVAFSLCDCRGNHVLYCGSPHKQT